MKPNLPREPRTIHRMSNCDKETEAINNAFYLLREMTSARRLSTLVRPPTRSELLSALDDFLALYPFEDGRERAREFREAALTWKEGEEIPQAVFEAGRRFSLSIGLKEPACGWENDDGYRVSALETETDDAEPPPAAEAAGAPQSSYRDASRKAAQLAQAIAGIVNFAGALASPRLWAKATSWPSREHLIEPTDELLSSLGTTPDPQNLAAPARTLRALLSTWEPGPDVPADISAAARELLSTVGVSAPPGGWDALEGPPDESSTDGQ